MIKLSSELVFEMHRRTPIAILVGLFALCLEASVALAGEDTPFPIWWSPTLGLESLDKIDERLEKKFWPDQEGGITVYKGEWPGVGDAFVDSCDSFNKLNNEGYYVRYELKIFYLHVTTCFILEELRQAQPSQTSYVEDIELSPELLNYLPAMVNPAASCDFLCRQHVANERRIPWSEFEVLRFLNVKVDHEGRMDVLTEGEHLTLEIMARADFNDDGVQDLLLWVHASATGGSWGKTTFFKLSRETSDDVLHVINADNYLCSIETYQSCNESYDYPSILRDTN